MTRATTPGRTTTGTPAGTSIGGLAGTLWRFGAAAVAPLLPWYLRRRAARGKEDPARLHERRGEGAARPVYQPPGRLLWLHAASVGETLSVLPVLHALAARAPDLTMLVTTGTLTAAAILRQRLPPALSGRVLHRFVPLDVPNWVARFLDGWRPDAAVFVESELWPNLIAGAVARGIPLALINARMSARSAHRWRLVPALGRDLLAAFAVILAQSEADAGRLRGLFGTLGAAPIQALGNLKYAAEPLPVDAAALAALRQATVGRPVLLGASTHPGEEAILLVAHRLLATTLPDLLTIIVPRHPERGPLVVEMVAELAAGPQAKGLAVARRGAGELPQGRAPQGKPGTQTDIYVADTLGELGLFYRLAGVALVGGSLVPHGGQNPLEPARLGCPILLGPHTGNFAEPVARLLAAGGARLVDGQDLAAALAAAAADVLTDANHGKAMAQAAAAAVAPETGLPDRIAEALLRLLPDAEPGGEPSGDAVPVALVAPPGR